MPERRPTSSNKAAVARVVDRYDGFGAGQHEPVIAKIFVNSLRRSIVLKRTSTLWRRGLVFACFKPGQVIQKVDRRALWPLGKGDNLGIMAFGARELGEIG